ncbi:probable aquaporin NIP-type [Cryptomeria japonica]|uniref:probable aquaporin NIP-type n=1 Tax=Cryptomeria japonica TaxID=3369 RepID=UPI0027DAAADF|nr:probable aquaporin NIP-type [Cryptomeria japonica]
MDGILTYVGVSAVFGLVIIMAIIYSVSHRNPLVSLAFSVVGKLSVKELPVYIVSQIAGATAAAALLHEIITNTSINVTVTVPVGHPFVSLVVEFIITFIRALVISGTATDPKALSQKIYHNSPIPLTFRT